MELEQLRRDALRSQCNVFAEGALRNLQVQWVTYVNFCKYYKLNAVPAHENTMVMYAQHLTQKVKLADTVQPYINGVKTLHSLAQLDLQAFQGVSLNLMLK